MEDANFKDLLLKNSSWNVHKNKTRAYIKIHN